jgi:hypothetical protein
MFQLVVHYLEGSPLVKNDLFRAKAHLALGIFIMENKFSVNADEEDSKAILQQFSVKRYITESRLAEPLILMQLIRPENRRHVVTDEVVDSQKDVIICLNEMKMGVIAKTISFPGFSTLIFNLLCSFAEGDEEESDEEDAEEKKESDENAEDDDDDSESEDSQDGDGWKSEYKKGCDWEIYLTELSDAFVGKRFIDLAVNLHNKLGIILFALRIKDLKGKGAVRTLLNPSDYLIPPKEKYQVEGFVIAKNTATSNLAFHDDNDDDSKRFELSNITAAFSSTIEAGAATVRRQSVAILNGGQKGIATPVKQKGWQTLMASHDVSAEEEQNQLEQLQKIEEEYEKVNYYLRENPISLRQATVKTSVLDEYPWMENHLVIMGKGISNLYDLIRPLRARYMGTMRHIVILHPVEIPYSIWTRISQFDGIFVVRGSSLEENDIRRAGIFRASQVIVLAEAMSQHNSSKTGSDALIDADAIFGYQCVKRLNDKASIVIEIVKEQNVSYLETGSKSVSDEGYKFSPQFASGSLFTSSMLDTVVCQVHILINVNILVIFLNILFA